MAKNRPSYPSIRRRQRNIIEGIGTRDIKYTQAAREFGVTTEQLNHFLDTRPQKLRKSYNRSTANAKLFELGERGQTRKVLGVRRIRVYEFREEVLQAKKRGTVEKYPNQLQIGRQVQRLYYRNDQGRQDWSLYTREEDLPNSINTIRFLYHQGRIDSRRYAKILTVWKQDYKDMSNANFEQYASELETEDFEG